ncbi:TetR family transcriptional regulator C-terminal domain-containing protein [Sphingomonas oryzagri]
MSGTKSEPKRTRIQIRNEALILKSARTVFADHGFSGATMEKIAELADMSQSNLHHYFKTKADLYLSVLERTLGVWIEPLEGLDPLGDPAAEIMTYVGRKLEMARKDPEASRVFAHEMLDGAPFITARLQTQVREKARRFADIVESWVAAGKMRPVDPYHLIFMIWAMTQHYADFAPQVKAVLGLSRLTKAEFEEADRTICSVLVGGLFTCPQAMSPSPADAVDSGQSVGTLHDGLTLSDLAGPSDPAREVLPDSEVG